MLSSVREWAGGKRESNAGWGSTLEGRTDHQASCLPPHHHPGPLGRISESGLETSLWSGGTTQKTKAKQGGWEVVERHWHWNKGLAWRFTFFTGSWMTWPLPASRTFLPPSVVASRNREGTLMKIPSLIAPRWRGIQSEGKKANIYWASTQYPRHSCNQGYSVWKSLCSMFYQLSHFYPYKDTPRCYSLYKGGRWLRDAHYICQDHTAPIEPTWVWNLLKLSSSLLLHS